jgi:hypothetical protein
MAPALFALWSARPKRAREREERTEREKTKAASAKEKYGEFALFPPFAA